jgi:hypothetical protein
MTEFILVIFIFAGNAPAVTTVPGFANKAECEAAEQQIRDKKFFSRIETVCLKQTYKRLD